jgi:hypothetical protein
MIRAVIDLEAAKVLHRVSCEILVEQGYLKFIPPFEALDPEEKVFSLRLSAAVGDVYLRGVR